MTPRTSMTSRPTHGSRALYWMTASLGIVGYTYAGYPAVIGMAAKRKRHSDTRSRNSVELPTMSVIIPALDEELVIKDKIADILSQSYPPGRMDVIVAADGSRDRTRQLAEDLGVTVLWAPERRGKSAAVNRAMQRATGDVVVMTDANCVLVPDALRSIAAHFVDSRVAVVSGAKTVTGDSVHGRGEGLYWRYESQLKRSESTFGCVMGAPGEIIAVRRETFRPIPEDVVNDDLHLTLAALTDGHRVEYEPLAAASEPTSLSIQEELERRTRITAGAWQNVAGHAGLADPRHGWTAVAFISHRVLRSIVTPPILVVALISSVAGSRRSRVAKVAATLQVVGYVGAVAGLWTGSRMLAAPFQFAFTNVAALRGAGRFLTGRQSTQWKRAERQTLS